MNGKLRKLEVSTDIKTKSMGFLSDISDSTIPFIYPVIGDFVIDRYAFCKVERKNLEHDSLILDLVDTSHNYGGASNVANILGTFCSCSNNKSVEFIFGCGSKDIEYLNRISLSVPNVFKIAPVTDSLYVRVIPLKTRYIGTNRGEYLFRVDAEPSRDTFPCFTSEVDNIITDNLFNINTNTIFISDYNKGFISKNLIQSLDDISHIKYRYCNLRPKKVVEYINLLKRKHRMHLLSFNKTEFIEVYDLLFDEKLDIVSYDDIQKLQEQISAKNLIITFGAGGFIYHDIDKDFNIKVDSIKSLSVGSKNIIGAGDMVSASFTFFDSMNRDVFIGKYDIDVILYLVNCCAFLKVCTGEYTVSFDLLRSYISGNLCLF